MTSLRNYRGKQQRRHGGSEKVAEFVSEAVDNPLPYDLTAAAIAAAPPVSSGDGGQQNNGNQSGGDWTIIRQVPNPMKPSLSI